MTGVDDAVPAAQLVGETLWSLGVRQVFGVVGSGNLVATAALTGAGARYVAARHEGAAVVMADAYARVSGQLAVCSVHQGPGLTNTITGLADAAKSRTPLLIIAGQASSASIRSNFAIDQAGLAERAGAIAEQLHRPETVVADVARAVRRAHVDRRPVVLNMPLDIQAAAVPRTSRPGTEDGGLAGDRVGDGLSRGRRSGAADAGPGAGGRASTRIPAATREAARHVARLLAAADRPLIMAGRGAVLSGAQDALRRLGERIGALLANSAVANGFFGDDPWTLGIAGGFSSDEAAALMGEADVVVGFGCSYTSWTTRHGHLFDPGAVVVQVDVEASALGSSERVDVGVLGDAAETARAVLGELEQVDDTRGWRTDRVAARMRRRAQPVEAAQPGTIHPRELSLELETMLPAERTVVIDGGHFIGWPATCWSVPDPAGFVFTSSGFQSIGLGLAAAIGAHMARPDRLTVLAAGDGGFLMSISELETLVRLRVPVLVVVYDDAAYGAEVHHFAPAGAGDPLHPDAAGKDASKGSGGARPVSRSLPAGLELVQFPPTDIAALAHGAGATGVTVRDVADLATVAAWLEQQEGPMVVDAKIDPTVVGYWAEQDFRGH